ncbi:asparaginase [Ornithinimicrobium pekingense]|nr:asparaginase [Ornithinimicrobium pekingense]
MVRSGRVAVGTLGGTITMVGGQGGGRPTLGAAELMSGLMGGLGDDIRVEGETLAQLPGASLTPQLLCDAVGWARDRVADGCAGAVLVQGTDTLPESAFLTDLYWAGDAPLVLTGAMRLASAVSADGPGNLRDACLAAETNEVARQGVVVCLGGQLHRATRVEKAHSWSTDAFTSGPAGLAGVVREGAVRLYSDGGRQGAAALTSPVRDPRVLLLQTYLGDDARTLEHVVQDEDVDAVVVEGFGGGHVPARVADVLVEAAGAMPVVVATSAHRGGTLQRTYGFPGSEMDLLERGVLLGGELSARKTRLLLWAYLAQGEPSTGGSLEALLQHY